jgi:nicotinate-nucleotide adenylyltransferase
MFGGTFDPVHYGHLRTVEAARLELALDTMLLLPNPRPPHKDTGNLTPYPLRKEMLRIALAEFPHLELATYEEDAVGPGYTTDTVKRVIAALPPGPRELWLIVGADALIELPQWKDPECLFRDTFVAALPRPGCDLSLVLPQYLARARILKTPLQEISATEIRRRLQSGEDVSGLLPAAVVRYIQEQSLYGVTPVARAEA